MESVKLLGSRGSLFVNRVRISLNIKSVKFEFQIETYGSAHESYPVHKDFPFLTPSELLLKSNPVEKKIPVLIHNGKPICESLIIVQYIDEVWTSGRSILPCDPHDRAIARFWAAFIDDKCFPALPKMWMAGGEKKKLAAAADELVEHLVLLEEAFVKCSQGKSFFGGDKIGYIDIALGCYWGWFKALEKLYDVKLFRETKTPCLLKWAERFLSDDAVKDVIPDTEEHLEFARKFIPLPLPKGCI